LKLDYTWVLTKHEHNHSSTGKKIAEIVKPDAMTGIRTPVPSVVCVSLQ
jgi:hypothetical protein